MRRKLFTATSIALLALAISGCAATGDNGTATQNPTPTQTFDASLIPTAPASDSLAVDAKIFDNGTGEYTFKVGTGPTWCTLNPDQKFAICEQNETDATYDQVPAPKTCKLSYGYQIRLWASKPSAGSTSELTCASSLYADPSDAQSLNEGETVSVAGITCFVVSETVRCDNQSKNYIVLGPEVWALG